MKLPFVSDFSVWDGVQTEAGLVEVMMLPYGNGLVGLGDVAHLAAERLPWLIGCL
jgi:hypothetical protein